MVTINNTAFVMKLRQTAYINVVLALHHFGWIGLVEWTEPQIRIIKL